jgi:hypothetical protein
MTHPAPTAAADLRNWRLWTAFVLVGFFGIEVFRFFMDGGSVGGRDPPVLGNLAGNCAAASS